MRILLLLFSLFTTSVTIYSQSIRKNLHLELTTTPPANLIVLQNYSYDLVFSERALLDQQIDTLTSTLKNDGYIDIKKKLSQKNDSTIVANFSLGTFFKTIQLYVQDDSPLSTYIEESGFTLRNDSILIETAFAKAYLEQLSTIASNSGDPFARFQIKKISKTKNKLVGQLTLTANEARTIDKYVLNGYEDFPEGFSRYYARLKEGTSFSQRTLLQQNELLETLPFVSSTKAPEVLFKKDSTIAYYYLKKNTVNQFDGFLGFASGEASNLRLDGYLDLLLTNNLNYGESLSLNYKADGNDQSQLKIQTTLPYLFRTPVGLEAEIALFRRDSTFSTTDLSANLFYTLTRHSSIGLGYISQTSENLRDTDIETATNITDYTSNGARASYKFIKRAANYFFPIKTSIHLQAGFLSRSTTLEELFQVPIEFRAAHNFEFSPKHNLYIRNITQHLESDNFVTNELFRFGGIQSIRGFDENTLLANTVSILNTEYRLILNQGLYVNTLFDVAYFENDLLNEQSQLYSVGVGAGVRTRAGVLKINLANGKFENLPFQFSNTRLHLILAIGF